jgi:hypothetical protein
MAYSGSVGESCRLFCLRESFGDGEIEISPGCVIFRGAEGQFRETELTVIMNCEVIVEEQIIVFIYAWVYFSPVGIVFHRFLVCHRYMFER